VTGTRFLHCEVMKRSLIAVLLFALAACRGETDAEKKTTWLGTPNPTDSSTTTAGDTGATASATHPGSPGGAAIVPDVDAGTTVLVMLNDNSIAVREQAIPPGPAVLTVENRGTEPHNLFIEGPGVSRAADSPIAEKGSATVDVTFTAGTYVLYCPLADHRQNGEQVQVTVAP
jgi:plastocyanin